MPNLWHKYDSCIKWATVPTLGCSIDIGRNFVAFLQSPSNYKHVLLCWRKLSDSVGHCPLEAESHLDSQEIPSFYVEWGVLLLCVTGSRRLFCSELF